MTEAFGLYALSGKATSFIAPLLIAVATTVSGSQQAGIVPLIVLFLIGLVLLALGKTRWRPRHVHEPSYSRLIAAADPWPVPAAAEQLANKLFGVDGDALGSRRRCRSAPMRRGCAAGLVELPETGPTGRRCACRRNRNWGQPVMIEFWRT